MARATRSSSDTAPTVLVGVGAGIAAYKVALVVREFRRLGWAVHVLPTARSLEFVGAETWRELSENQVETSVFHRDWSADDGRGHVELARAADLVVLAPATADLLARARAGLADDLLTTTLLASAAPVIAFPAMHTQMWLSHATQENVAALRERGWTVVPPGDGALSSGDRGPGRLPEPQQIVALVQEALSQDPGIEATLAGKRVVVTAGGTQEPLDPVRYIGNRSSGTMGIALARRAAAQGADVVLIAAGITEALPETNPRIRVERAMTAAQMLEAVQREAGADALIMAAAVADFAPARAQNAKIKKSGDQSLVLELRQTPDILATMAAAEHRPTVVVGFGAETGDEDSVMAMGAQKARRKGADLLAVNRVGTDAGFGDVQSALTYFGPDGTRVGGAEGNKGRLAADLVERLSQMLQEGAR